jgi:ATP-binding cassette subfamily B protein
MQADRVEELRETHLAGTLSADALTRFAAAFQPRTLFPGDVLSERGRPVDGWHLVVGGRARVLDVAPDAFLLPAVVGPGASIGDRGLLGPAVWAHSTKVETQLEVLTLTPPSFEAFQRTLDDAARLELRRRIERNADFEFLRRLQLLAHLSAREVGDLLDALVPVRYAQGDSLYLEDAAADGCYIVRRGRVYLLKHVGQSRRRLAVRREGEILGELELLYGTTRIADAVAASDVELFLVRREVFDRFLPEGTARAALFELASERLLQYQNMLSEPDAAADQSRIPNLEVRWVRAPGRWFAPPVPVVRTASREAAGLACLAMIDSHQRRESSWQDRLESLLWERQVPTLVTFSRTAEECGYFTRLVEPERSALSRSDLPAIIEDDDGTLAVLFDVTRRRVVVSNPARGVRAVDRAPFTRWWTGRLLTLAPPATAGYGAQLRGYARPLGRVAVASLLVLLFGLAGPLAGKTIVDRVLVSGDLSLLQLLVVALAAATVFRILAAVLRDYLLAHTTHEATLALQQRFLRHVLHLPQRTLVTRPVADLVVRFRENERLVERASATLLTLTVDAAAVVTFLLVLSWLSRPMALIALAFVGAYALVTLAAASLGRLAGRRSMAARAALESHLIEVVSGMHTLKALLVERLFYDRGRRLMVRVKTAEFAASRLDAGVETTGAALHQAALVGIIGYGARLASAGAATTGDMVASLGVFGAMLVPLTSLLEARAGIGDVRTAVAGLDEVASLEPEVVTTAAVPPPITGHVSFHQVSFRYPGSAEDALTDVTFEVLPGQTVAIVGRSGSGKTTLVNLLMGLYAPTTGSIYIDHLDIQSIPTGALRRQLGVVEQQPFLFDGTLRENIAKSDPSASEERVVAAATVAGLHGFASTLPRGYDTPVGERGAALSGGEKQRVMIARALLGNPRLLILDEATSSVDAAAEQLIQQNIRRAAGGRTTFVIAHRLSTIRDASLIVVLDRGRVVETGTHAALMAARRLYYYLNTRTV